MIRHMVTVRFRPDLPATEKAAIYKTLGDLRGHLSGILDYRTFANISPEAPVVRGFLDMFWFDFADAASRDAYLIDPAHQAAGARLVAACGGVDGLLVCDIALP